MGQQSGIFTGDGGFDLTVDGKTTLIGGAITTTDAAVAAGLNKYVSKGGIVTQDIENTSSYKGDAISVGVSLGNTTGKPQATMNGLGYGTDGDSNSSITKAGITGIAGNSGITTDNQADYAGALDNVFDETRVNEELGAQTQITQEFGKEAPKAVGDYANNRIKAIRADATLSDAEKAAAIAKWDEGGVYRIAAHTALGALGTGSIEGALTTGGVAAAAPTLNDVQEKIEKALVDKGMSESVASGTASGLVSLTLLGAGAAVGLDTSSTVTATNVDANNRQLHPSEIDWIKKSAKAFADKLKISPEEAERRLAQQAAKQTDLFWLLTLDKGVDPDAQAFLSSSGKSFTNEKGQQQAYFTTQSNDFSTPSRLAIEANQNKDFYQRNLISGNNDNISQGLKDLGAVYGDKASQYWDKNSAGGIAKDAGSLAYETGKGAAGAAWGCISGIGQCATDIKDDVVNSAQTMGQEAASISENNLESIYGQDVSDAQRALLGLRSLGAVASATGASKAITGGTRILYKSVTNKNDRGDSNSNSSNNNTSNNSNNKVDGKGSSLNPISQQAGQDYDFNYRVDNDLSFKDAANRAEQDIANITNSKDWDADRKASQLEFDASMGELNASIDNLNKSIKADADRQATDIRVDDKINEADRIVAEFNRSKANGTSSINSSTNGVNSTPSSNLNDGYNQTQPTNYADRSGSNANGRPAPNSDNEVPKPITVISPELESKILYGQRATNSQGNNTNRLIGAHSGNISNANPSFAVETISVNSDGTRNAKLIAQFEDGNISKIKNSTLFPERWTDADVISAVKQTGNSTPLATRASDGASLFQSTVDGVKVEVIKIGNNVTAGYPCGRGCTSADAFGGN